MKNKRNGFTLAEILITLGIIGVIAALVIPALNNKINDMEFRTAYKNAFATLSEAAKQAQAANNTNLYDALNPNNCPITVLENLKPYLNVVKFCDDGTTVAGNCWHKDLEWSNKKGDKLSMSNVPFAGQQDIYGKSMILNNGTMIMMHQPACGANNLDNGGYYIAMMLVDTNGWKGPNVLGRDIQNISIASRKSGLVSHEGFALGPGFMYVEDSALCTSSIPNGIYNGIDCGRMIINGEDY